MSSHTRPIRWRPHAALCAILTVAASSLLLHGCATPAPQYTGENRESVAPDSAPRVVMPDGETLPAFASRPADHFVEVHLRAWTSMNTPSETSGWKLHFMIGPDTKPDWSYEEIAPIEMRAKGKPDMAVIDEFIAKARELGGDAVIDVYRAPLIGSFQGPMYGVREAPIHGHVYHGIVVRKTGG